MARTRVRPLKRRIRDASLQNGLITAFPRMEFRIYAYRIDGMSYVRLKAVDSRNAARLLFVRDISDLELYGSQAGYDLLVSQLWLVNPP